MTLKQSGEVIVHPKKVSATETDPNAATTKSTLSREERDLVDSLLKISDSIMDLPLTESEMTSAVPNQFEERTNLIEMPEWGFEESTRSNTNVLDKDITSFDMDMFC